MTLPCLAHRLLSSSPTPSSSCSSRALVSGPRLTRCHMVIPNNSFSLISLPEKWKWAKNTILDLKLLAVPETCYRPTTWYLPTYSEPTGWNKRHCPQLLCITCLPDIQKWEPVPSSALGLSVFGHNKLPIFRTLHMTFLPRSLPVIHLAYLKICFFFLLCFKQENSSTQ